MAIQAMGVTETIIADEVQILKRPGFEAIPITLDSTAFTDGVCRAGAPIGAGGVIKNDKNCIGILKEDVLQSRPQGTILKKAYVRNDVITSHYGTEIADTAKAALPMIVFE